MHAKRALVYSLIVLVLFWFVIPLFSDKSWNKKDTEYIRTRRVANGHSKLKDQLVVRHFYKSEGFGGDDLDPKDVTFVTHCTPDRLHNIIKIQETWDGPISVSVLVLKHDAAFVDDAIDGLRLCWPNLRQRLTFHLVYYHSGNLAPNGTGLGAFTYLACKDIMRKMIVRKPEIEKTDIKYPYNLMRNTALRGVYTDFVLVADIEMIPSQNLRNSFVEFALTNNLFSLTKSKFYHEESLPTSAYIIPAFESKIYYKLSKTKKELIKAVENKESRQLLQDICPSCQSPVDYKRWFSLSDFGSRLEASYEVTFSPMWEPFYIVRRKQATFDSKFIKYGQDRLIQMCEFKRRNFKFFVLNKSFLIREGYKFKGKVTESQSLRMNSPRDFHEAFRNEMRTFGYNENIVRLC